MTENQSSSVPVWVWLLGGCAILALVMACLAAVFLFFGGFLFTSTAFVSTPVAIPTVVAVTVEIESPPTDLPPTATDTPPQTPTPETAEPTAAGDPEETAEPTGESETPPTEAPTIDDPFAGDRDEIEANVQELRGLPQLEEVNPTGLTPEQLRERLEADFMEGYSEEEARHDVLVLNAFDFLERDFDLYNFSIDLLTEQVAGFYDPETDEFVVIRSGDATFTALEQFVYAHEFVHALQDQHFQLDLLADESLEAEALFAIRALAEGDATLAQTLYVTQGYFTQEQLLEIVTEAENIDSTVLNSAPPVLARELEFPYAAGLEFVQALYAQGGYSAVDEAWDNLPQSTEHIIHPDRYLNGDAPQVVTVQPLTDTLGAGWQRIDEETLGEFYLREYLVQQLDAGEVETAATGWGGDRYTVYWNEAAQEIVLVFKLAWDTAADGEEFFAAYENYPANLFGAASTEQPDGGLCWQGGDVICLYQVGEETMIVRAPDLEMAANVAAVQG